jgi:(E)-4-hydroxy-3-methylbut-2-enyl-diphosphate synthase
MIGKVPVGGDAPVTIQSMTNVPTRDVEAVLSQIKNLAALGCDIIRVAVPDLAAAHALVPIVTASPIPVVADIHFDYKLALAAIDAGAAAIRLNPGNIDKPDHVVAVAERAGEAGIPIRVGANSGSVSLTLLRKLESEGRSKADAMVEALIQSVMNECEQLERCGFDNIKVSLKSSNVPITVAACREFARRSDYPQHIGVTEAGSPGRGIVKSAVGIGALLLDGIGDTIRVSLTADPVEEIIAAKRILECCGLREDAPEIISCPTCGRTEIDLIGMVNRVESLISEIKSAGNVINLRKIAVMGCPVNGPGEAREADLGLAGGKRKVVVFRLGEVIGTFDPEAGFEYLKVEILKNSSPVVR